MSFKTIEGERLHTASGKMLRYSCRYEVRLIGIVYIADVLLNGKRTRLVAGFISWTLRAFPPRRRVEESVWQSIDFTDMEKLMVALNEA
jgi:hypothetical protein